MLQECDLQVLMKLHNPIWVYDVDLYRIHWANEKALQLWEAESSEELYSRDFRVTTSDAVYNLLKHELSDYEQGREKTQWWSLYPKDKQKEIYCHFSGVTLNDGRTAMLCQSIVTKEFLETEALIHSSSTIASLWDGQQRLISANPIFTDLYGSDISKFSQLFSSEVSAMDVWDNAILTDEFEADLLLPTPKGEQWHNVKMFASESGGESLFVLRQYDITDLKQSELHHKKLAVKDPLTQLLNRYGVVKQIEDLVENASNFSMFFIDLDNFKNINDNYGHIQGDYLLVAVAGRLQHRFPDALGIARLGGDEFLILYASTQTEVLNTLGSKMVTALSEPFYLDDIGEVQIGASIGISRFPEDGASLDTLLVRSDIAMYKAKHSGKNDFVYFSERISEEVARRHAIRRLIPAALSNNEFDVFYHYIKNTASDSLDLIEVLPLWNNSELGNVAIEEFLPVAESNGMLNLIRRSMLEKAINHINSNYDANVSLLLSVTPVEIQSLAFFNYIRELLNSSGFQNDRLVLEVKAGDRSVNEKSLIKAFDNLHQLGVQLSVGGMGSGRSLLPIIHQLPLSYFRLSNDLVSQVCSGSLPVIQAFTLIAKQIGARVVAEGVKNAHEARFLIEIGCHLMDYNVETVGGRGLSSK